MKPLKNFTIQTMQHTYNTQVRTILLWLIFIIFLIYMDIFLFDALYGSFCKIKNSNLQQQIIYIGAKTHTFRNLLKISQFSF